MIDIPTAPLSEQDEEDEFSVLKLGKLAAHHQRLLELLQGVEEGRVPNLMVLMPPGSAKSTYSDVVFVPWFMARKPRRNVIVASYASDIAKKQGRRARQLISSRAYQNLMQVEMKPDQKAADEWALTNGSEYMAGGLLSGLTGNRAALGILDDPIRGREAAESETIREKTWDAYIDDFCSRLIPGAPQVMILTRWHEADPAGRILPERWDGESGWFDGRDGRKWYVLCLPAIADRADDPMGRQIGETLWPEWFSLEHWEPFKQNPRTWASLYQQRPTAEDGTYFQRDWFRWYDEPPKHLNVYLCSDYAVTEGGGDWTEHGLFGVDPTGNIYVLDWWSGQTASDVWVETLLDMVQMHRPLAIFGESGQIRKSVEPFLTRRSHERRVYGRFEWISRTGDKAAMARGFQARASMGKVYLPTGKDWATELLRQLLTFPAGKHDDKVDTCALMGMALDMAHPAIVPAKEVQKYVDRWDRVMNQDNDEADDWKTA